MRVWTLVHVVHTFVLCVVCVCLCVLCTCWGMSNKAFFPGMGLWHPLLRGSQGPCGAAVSLAEQQLEGWKKTHKTSLNNTTVSAQMYSPFIKYNKMKAHFRVNWVDFLWIFRNPLNRFHCKQICQTYLNFEVLSLIAFLTNCFLCTYMTCLYVVAETLYVQNLFFLCNCILCSIAIELSSRDVITLDGAIIPVPTAFNCIETAIGKS